MEGKKDDGGGVESRELWVSLQCKSRRRQEESIAMIEIREAREADAEALLGIYAPYVERTAITFEYDVPTVEEFRGRIRAIGGGYPYIVAVEAGGGAPLGYAYAHEFYGRAAYRRSVETSIYLAPAARRQGIGRRLYGELERRLRERGFLNMYACIAYTDNAADNRLPAGSVGFHEAMGFALCGRFHECGYKFGRWYDVVWMEKVIGPHE